MPLFLSVFLYYDFLLSSGGEAGIFTEFNSGAISTSLCSIIPLIFQYAGISLIAVVLMSLFSGTCMRTYSICSSFENRCHPVDILGHIRRRG